MNPLFMRVAPILLLLTAVQVAPVVRAAPSPGEEDERTLQDAGLSGEGSALLAFFHARARMDVEGDRLRRLLAQLAADNEPQCAAAKVELLGLGALALQALRQAANDPDRPQAAALAALCLPWLEGPSSHKLLIAAAHVLAQRKPDGAAAALLSFLPFADNPDVVTAINNALAAVAAPQGKPDPALLHGLSDRHGVRRAAAGVALCRAVPPQQVPDVRKLLKDPAAAVRLRAAKALAEAHDAEAISVLIDLLGQSSADQRQIIEDLLKPLAGEWAPVLQFATDDEVSRCIRRDAWASWWRHSDGPALLAALAKHTLTADKRQKLQEHLKQLGSDDFTAREEASRRLLAFGRLALPNLRTAVKDRDPEVARRTKMLIERIEKSPTASLPLAALRLLAVRKPAGAVEALLAYSPFAEDETREDEVRKSLAVLARRDSQLDPALRRALADAQPKVRVIAAEALIEGGGEEGRAAVRKLLAEEGPSTRLRLALAMARGGDPEGVSVVIDLLPLLPAEESGRAEDALYQLAGETAPESPSNGKSEDKKQRRDAWAAWWKVNSQRVDLSRLNARPLLGYTLICTNKRVLEVDRQGKMRWSLNVPGDPADVRMLSGERLLIPECVTKGVSELERNGNVLWKKANLPAVPANAQRLPNGNTFIAFNGNLILEVDRAGNEIYKIDNINNLLSAYRTRQGPIVCVTGGNQCLLVDTSGKKLKSFATKYQVSFLGCLDVRPDGRILIASHAAGKVMEYDREGKLLHEWDAPQVSTATGLANGHILACCPKLNRVVELNRAGKVVWEQTIEQAWRARRR
jgi:HEAT repeat protein